MMYKRTALVLLSVMLAACSTTPAKIQHAPDNDPQLSNVRLNVQQYQQQPVRWGGEVVQVENTDKVSIIQMVQYPLNHFGRPITTRNSQGRFLAVTTEFIDPMVFKRGTLLTFAGTIDGEQARQVDQKQLSMPVVQVEEIHRWPVSQPAYRYPYPYDPFYRPYHRFHGFHGHYWHHPRYHYW